MVAVHNALLFAADDVEAGDELWRSDGTDAGTALLKDVNAPTNSSEPQRMMDVDGSLMFAAKDGAVTVDELVTAVNIALGAAYAQACPLVDTNDDGVVTVDELLTAVNQALNGCGGSRQR